MLIAAKVEAGAFSLLIFSKSPSTFSILVCSLVLSNACFSTVFSVLALLFTAEVFPVANSSFLAGFASSLPGETATSVFSSTTSRFLADSPIFSIFSVLSGFTRSSSFGFGAPIAGWFLSSTTSALTTCVPKNISAATATEAAPKLYLRIE